MTTEYEFHIYHKRLIRELESFLVGATILDVGCGGAPLSSLFLTLSAFVVGVDIHRDERWANFREENINFLVCDARYMPFRDQAFDVTFEKDVLHHINDYMKAFDEIFRVSKKNVILIEANRYHPISYIHMVKLHGHDHLSRNEFKRLILSRVDNNNVVFATREAHFYPFKSNSMFKLLILIEDLMERLPLIKNMLSHNVAIITKSNAKRLFTDKEVE